MTQQHHDLPQQQRADNAPWHMGADDWNRRYANEDYLWSVHPNALLAEQTAALPAGRALDLAAGECRNAIWLASQGWTVDAVDFAELALAKGQRLAQSRQLDARLHCIYADLETYQPAARQYALVTVLYLQLSWPTLAPILRRAANAVAPGGTLLLIAHDPQNLSHGHGGPRHAEVLYSAEQLAALLADELHIEQAAQLPRTVHTADGPRQALDCLLRASRR